ncbi:MAG: hypothetical protein LBS25_06145, partial [Candidatus Symbiothrix sp.]|nr:hypothetical protein [Candidatus Symbiothrix sp.]
LQVSNGINVDNAVILFDNRASNDFDRFDSEKMSNNHVAIPEIYTLAGTEKAVINSFNGQAADREFALGFKTGTAGSFSISASTLNNIANACLIDKTAEWEFDLTSGASYEFTSDIADNADRFAIAFRAPQVVTGIANIQPSQPQVFYNLMGQKVQGALKAGVYIVKSGNRATKVIIK